MSGAGSGFGVADRLRRPKGDLDAATASWTIETEDDGATRDRVACRLPKLICRLLLRPGAPRASVSSRLSAARSAPGAAERCEAALLTLQEAETATATG